ncbi:tyrosine-type recombinase/integrase [Streptomyces sp. PA5.6]|uniref:tyrosine-type recombinase/integrase n=1 Tax=Streptomyces sp. PA5.6 TaxID=3035651 RepID=UPI0039047777
MGSKTPFKKAQRVIEQWLGTKTDRTREEYERDISRYVQHCVAQGVNPLKAKPDVVASFLTALRDEYGLKPRTRLRAYNVGSAFYSYARRWDYVRRNPFADVEKPKISPSPELGMTMEETTRFLKEAFYTSSRLYALVVTLLLLGLRISELLGANIEDIGTVQGQRVLWVLRKGRDEKTDLPLPDIALAALAHYIGERRTGPIFITGSGKRLSRQGAHDTIVRLARRSGVPGIHPHLIRATTTVLLLELEQALHKVQELLDHRDPRTTIDYNKSRRRLADSPVFALERALVEASR